MWWRLTPQFKKRGGAAGAAGCVEGLWSASLRGARKKVLKIDRPLARGFLSLTAFQAEGCGGGFAAIFKKEARLAPRVV